MNTSIPQRHGKELMDGAFPVYRIFTLLDRMDLDDETRQALGHDIACLVDQIVFLELPVPVDGLCAGAEKLLTLPLPIRIQAFRAWHETLERGTSRKALRTIVLEFPHWVMDVKPLVAEHALAILPQIAPVIGELKGSGVSAILGCIDGAGSEENRRAIAAALAAYGETTGAIVSGCCRIATHTVRWHRCPELGALTDAVPVSAMEAHIDSERLIPAAAELCDAGAAVSEETGRESFSLVLLLASRQHSAAYKTTRTLTRILPRMDPTTTPVYLADLGLLVQRIGLRTLGFGLRRLPRLYKQCGRDKTSLLIQAAGEIAGTLGTTAAETFLDGKTEISRELSGR